MPRHVVDIDPVTGAVTVRLLDPDCIVPDTFMQRRHHTSQTSLDRLDAEGEIPPRIRTGKRQGGRWASAWLQWEAERQERRPPAAASVLAEPVKPKPAASVSKRRRGRPPKIRAPAAPAAE
jgi:hypothetical protein